jgi:hypothetical protein
VQKVFDVMLKSTCGNPVIPSARASCPVLVETMILQLVAELINHAGDKVTG